MPSVATPITPYTYDTIYYCGAEGYGFAFAFENPGRIDEDYTSVQQWDKTDIRVQIDSGQAYSYEMTSNVTPNGYHSLFGGFYLDAAIPVGPHTVTMAVKRTVNGVSTWYKGTMNLIFAKEEQIQTYPYKGTTDYFSNKKGSKIHRFVVNIDNYDQSSNIKITSVQLVKNGTTTPVATAGGQGVVSGGYFYSGCNAHYLARYHILEWEDSLEERLSFCMPQQSNSTLESYVPEMTLTRDVEEGWYDVIVTTGNGITATYPKRYYATDKPVIYRMGFRNKKGADGNVGVIAPGADYVSAFIYGVNITDSVYPVYYKDGTAVTTFTGKTQPLHDQYIYSGDWGKVYLLNKTEHTVWNRSDEEYRFLDIGVSSNAGSVIDERANKADQVYLPYGPLYAVGERFVRAESSSWMTLRYNVATMYLDAGWIAGADEVGIVRYASFSDRDSRIGGTHTPRDVEIINERGDGVIVSDEYVATWGLSSEPISVYKKQGGMYHYRDIRLSYNEYGWMDGDGYAGNLVNAQGINQYLQSGLYYEIYPLENMNLITTATSVEGKSVDAVIPAADKWKLHSKGMYRLFSYEKKGGKLIEKYAIGNFSGGSVPAAAVTINLDASETTIGKGKTYQLTATVGPDGVADKSVTWSSNKGAVATVDSNGLVTANGIGTATITATSVFNKNKKATCTVRVVERVEPVTGFNLLTTAKSMTVGELWQPGEGNAEASPVIPADYAFTPEDTTEREVIWESGDPETVEVLANGGIAAKKAGSVTLTATVRSASGAVFTGTCIVTVAAEVIPVNSISLNRNSVTFTKSGETVILTAYLNPADATDQTVVWESNAETLVTVTPDPANPLRATLQAVGNGSVTAVVVRTGDGTKSATCVVKMAENEISHGAAGDPDHYDDSADYLALGEDQKQGLWIASVPDDVYTYNGTKHMPEVRVYDGTKLLTKGTDYTLAWKNNINAGKPGDTHPKTGVSTAPAAVVRFRGNYSGVLTKEFTINRTDLTDTYTNVVDIAETAVLFRKNMKLPVPVIRVNGRKLAENRDFTTDYVYDDGSVPVGDKRALGAGSYTITITGIGNYQGIVTPVKLHLVDATSPNTVMMNKVQVTRLPLKSFAADAVSGEVKMNPGDYTVTYKDKTGTLHTLSEGTDFTVGYLNNQAAGTATMILTGSVNFGGTGSIAFVGERRLTFKITGIPLNRNTVTVTGITDRNYTGSAVTQDMAALHPVAGGSALTENQDYKVSYLKNVNAGTATIVFTGMGGYTGTYRQSFKINKVDLSTFTDPASLVADAVPYEKGGVRPVPVISYNGKTLVAGKDYAVTYKNNTVLYPAGSSIKQPVVTVTGRGNFSGAVSKTFDITVRPIRDLETRVLIPDKAYSPRKNAWISAPVITDTNGKVLRAGVDYEKLTAADYSYRGKEWGALPQIGQTVTVTVHGKGAYTGTLTTSYRIIENNLAGARIIIDPNAKIYATGQELVLEQSDFKECYFGKSKTPLVLHEDFEIVSWTYTNNVKKGTATVILRGKGNYGGTKKVTFRISAKPASTQ